MHVIATVAAVAITLGASLTLVHYLLRVITALRSISDKLSNARLLLITAAVQTEPAGDLVGAVAGNVEALDQLVTDVGRSLGLIPGGAR